MKRYLYGLLVVLSLLLGACSSSLPSAPTTQTLAPTPGGPAQPASASRTTSSMAAVTVGIKAEPVKLDPHNSGDAASFTAYDYVVEGLVERDKDDKIAPVLATSWRFSEDGTSFTVELRKGVKFHDGSDLNADAVKANFDRILSPDLRLVAYNAFKDSIYRVEVVDQFTVRFYLKGPRPSFIFDLANSYAKIMSTESLNRSGDEIAQRPVGTGPFRLVEWTPRQHVVLEAFRDYWSPPPKLARVILRPIPDATQRIIALEARDIDVSMGPTPEDLARLQSNPELQVLTSPSQETFTFQINTRKQALAGKLVRQALNYAIDKDSVIKTIYRGFAVPLDSPLAATVSGHVATGMYKYDPQKAKALLAQAGYGQGLRLVLWTTSGRYLQDQQLAESVAGYLRDVGVEVQLVTLDNTAYLERIRKPSPDAPPEYDLVFQNAQPGTGEANWAWSYFVDSRSWPPTGMNTSFYKNPHVDSLIDQARVTLDETRRNAMHQEIQGIVWQDAPWIFLLTPQQTAAAWSKIKGAYFTPAGVTVKHAYLEP